MNGIEQLLTQNVSAIIISAIFIFYMRDRDRMSRDTYKQFNEMIGNHLHAANQVIKDDTNAKLKFVATLQQLSDCIKALNGKAKRSK